MAGLLYNNNPTIDIAVHFQLIRLSFGGDAASLLSFSRPVCPQTCTILNLITDLLVNFIQFKNFSHREGDRILREDLTINSLTYCKREKKSGSRRKSSKKKRKRAKDALQSNTTSGAAAVF